MKLANLDGRAALVLGDEIADVAAASDGRFDPDPMALYAKWDAFRDFAAHPSPPGPVPSSKPSCATRRHDPTKCSPSSSITAATPRNRHGAARDPARVHQIPLQPRRTFDDIANAADARRLGGGTRRRHRPHRGRGRRNEAWSHVAGLTIGQDITDRHLQMAAAAPVLPRQVPPRYGPVGPWLVTPDELHDPDDLGLGCSVNGETMQDARTTDLVFDVPRLIVELSAVLPLLPGDILFTGTPAGVGVVRKPPRFLQPGDTLETWIEGSAPSATASSSGN